MDKVSPEKDQLNGKQLPLAYRSVQDSGRMLRYTDAELEVFKMRILQCIEDAEFELLKSEAPGNGLKRCELPTESVYKEMLEVNTQKQRLLVRELQLALKRIENKTYGICMTSGKLIDKERLMRVPFITSNYDDLNDLPY
jgi:DnaK suppressor protein